MPTPTALKVVSPKGRDRTSHRRVNRSPTPRLGTPTMPKGLSKVARAIWRETVDELIIAAPKLITRVDGGVLAQYCQAFERWQQAEAAIQADVDAGRALDRFKVVVAVKYSLQMHMAADRIGLSPAARTRLALPEAMDEGDDLLK